jgi:hypothetical protein
VTPRERHQVENFEDTEESTLIQYPKKRSRIKGKKSRRSKKATQSHRSRAGKSGNSFKGRSRKLNSSFIRDFQDLGRIAGELTEFKGDLTKIISQNEQLKHKISKIGAKGTEERRPRNRSNSSNRTVKQAPGINPGKYSSRARD